MSRRRLPWQHGKELLAPTCQVPKRIFVGLLDPFHRFVGRSVIQRLVLRRQRRRRCVRPEQCTGSTTDECRERDGRGVVADISILDRLRAITVIDDGLAAPIEAIAINGAAIALAAPPIAP